jgi:hypothetical protein
MCGFQFVIFRISKNESGKVKKIPEIATQFSQVF